MENSSSEGDDIRHSPLFDQLVHRDQKLEAELSKLQEKFNQMRQELAILESERPKLEERESKIADFEREVITREKHNDSVNAMRKNKDVIEQQTMELHSIAVNLRNELEQAKNHFDELRKEVEKKRRSIVETDQLSANLNAQKIALLKEDAELKELEKQYSGADKVIRQAKRKAQDISRLHQMVKVLQEDITFRESEITKLEEEAAEHQKLLDETAQKKAELDKRKSAAEEKSRKILEALQERDEKRKASLNLREEIRQKRIKIQKEQNELDELESKISKEEEEFEEKVRLEKEKARMEAAENERQIAKQLRLESLQKERSENASKLRSRVDEYLNKFEDDATVIEQRFARLEQAATNRRNAVELEQSKWMALMKGKLADADASIAALERKIRENEDPEVLKQKIQKLESEHDEAKRRQDEERHQLNELVGGPGSQREALERAERETREEREKIAKEEYALNTRALEQQKEEETLLTQQDDLAIRKDNIASQENIQKMRRIGSSKMKTLYENQLREAENRYEALKKQYDDLVEAFA